MFLYFLAFFIILLIYKHFFIFDLKSLTYIKRKNILNIWQTVYLTMIVLIDKTNKLYMSQFG